MTACFEKFLDAIKKDLTAYDLFAATVVSMVFGHVVMYFCPDMLVLRVPDRFFVPVFLISIGYNTGRKLGTALVFGAVLLTLSRVFFEGQTQVNFLGTIILVRAFLEPVAELALKNRYTVWGSYAVLLLLAPLSGMFMEYGTLAVIMALAGWINRHRADIDPNIVKPHEYFIMAFVAFLAVTQMNFQFSVPAFLAVAFGSGIVFCLLYDMKRLLLNSVRRRPKDMIERVCALLGHKSLEIYILHMVIFQLTLIWILI